MIGFRGIGAADTWLPNGTYLTDAGEKYLKYIYHELARINYDNFHNLYKGEEIKGLDGLRGKELDYALVELEQNHVERLTGIDSPLCCLLAEIIHLVF